MFAIFAAVALGTAQAQSFAIPIKGEIIGQPEVYVVTAEGDRHEGTLGIHSLVNGQISSVQVVNDSGKQQYKARDLKEMGLKPSGVAALGAVVAGAASGQASEADLEDVLDREYIYFQQAEIGLISRNAMLQILNPGFNSRISVFSDPDAEASRGFIMGMIFGNAEGSYLVAKDGEKVQAVQKRGYRRSFRKLFGDCETMEITGRVRYWDIADHVYAYEQACGAETP